MHCACNDQGKAGMTYCERHAIEHKRRLKVVAADLAMTGERLRVLLVQRVGGAPNTAVVEAEREWLAALRRAKEAAGA